MLQHEVRHVRAQDLQREIRFVRGEPVSGRAGLSPVGERRRLPEIHGVAKALIAAYDSDAAAAAAWDDRMRAVRGGCRDAVAALDHDGVLAREWTAEQATDVLWTMLTVQNWERLTIGCDWSTKQYVERMQILTRRALVREDSD